MTAQRLVYLVAKVPRPGFSKTRLSPALTPVQAAALALAFLRDTIATVQNAGLEPRVLCRSAAEAAELRRLLCDADCAVTSQTGAGLGAALESAFRQGLRDSGDAVIVLGADSPTLPGHFIQAAFARLNQGLDVVLGPSQDGGYYLLAARALHPALFRNMPWSTNLVARETIRRCASEQLRLDLLPLWYDVDDPASLRHLQADLARSRPEVAVHTRALLAQLVANAGCSAGEVAG